MCLTYNVHSPRNDALASGAVLTLYKVVHGEAGDLRTVYMDAPWHADRVNVARGRLADIKNEYTSGGRQPGRRRIDGGALHFYDSKRTAAYKATMAPGRLVLTCYVLGADVIARGTFEDMRSTAAKRCYPTKAAALAAIKRRGLTT